MNMDFSHYKLETDIVFDENNDRKRVIRRENNHGLLTIIRFDEIDKKLEKYICKELSNILIKEKLINKYALIVGLGNIKISPDSLGVRVINDIIVTSNLDNNKLTKISAIKPSVKAVTGIDTFKIINGITKEIKPDYLIVIDSLKTSNINNLNKIIQISNIGLKPGSGVNSNNKEITKDTIGKKVITIGVPTVIRINNLYVTDINIDEIIEKLSYVIASSINKTLNKDII